MPVVKGDKVKVLRGSNKGKEGKVVEVYRKKWVIPVSYTHLTLPTILRV